MPKLLLKVVLSAVLVALLFSSAAITVVYTPIVGAERAEEIIIDYIRGESVLELAAKLKNDGLIVSARAFEYYVLIKDLDNSLKAGRYVLKPSYSIHEIAEIISGGRDLSSDIAVTIPEGLNVAEIDKIFSAAGLIAEGDFLKIALSQEGKLFPDTYRFAANSNATTIAMRMHDNFNLRTSGGEKISDNVIIIASMLEKEVRTEGDMRIVAGIISKRLKINRPLEIDASVAYSVCLSSFGKGQFCNVAKVNIVDNMARNSPYNTYMNLGLPPTPISNPGLRAIKAALEPEESDYLYYLSKSNGETVFSKTFQEHSVARRKYILNKEN